LTGAGVVIEAGPCAARPNLDSSTRPPEDRLPMSKRLLSHGPAALAALVAAALATAGPAAAKPIAMPTVTSELQQQHQILAQHVLAPIGKLQPPAPPCPENGMLPAPFSNCGLPEFPATTLPFPGNMAYWGGHVQATPKVYLVYWGWGEKGAFGKQARYAGSWARSGVFATSTRAWPPRRRARSTCRSWAS